MDLKKEVQQILNDNALPIDNGSFIRIIKISLEEGYKKGWEEATLEACKEIAKNYRPNE